MSAGPRRNASSAWIEADIELTSLAQVFVDAGAEHFAAHAFDATNAEPSALCGANIRRGNR